VSEMSRRIMLKNEGQLLDEWRVWNAEGKESIIWVRAGTAPFCRHYLTDEKSPPTRSRYVGRCVIRNGDIIRVK
jgi:hypothetical protein